MGRVRQKKGEIRSSMERGSLKEYKRGIAEWG